MSLIQGKVAGLSNKNNKSAWTICKKTTLSLDIKIVWCGLMSQCWPSSILQNVHTEIYSFYCTVQLPTRTSEFYHYWFFYIKYLYQHHFICNEADYVWPYGKLIWGWCNITQFPWGWRVNILSSIAFEMLRTTNALLKYEVSSNYLICLLVFCSHPLYYSTQAWCRLTLSPICWVWVGGIPPQPKPNRLDWESV